MVDPLTDIAASCKSCHAADYQAKAQIYATTLGVTIGTSAAAPTQAASQPAASTTPAAAVAPAAAPAVGHLRPRTWSIIPSVITKAVLGQKPVNVGNVILIVMIAAMLFGGGYFVLRREGWVSVSFQDTRQIQATKTVQEGYPADVVEMVPELAKLKPEARRNLRQILAKPGTAAELFASIVKLIKPDDASTLPEENTPKG